MEDIAKKKQAIFESALDLIKDHGFHGTPMSLVAKNAGVAAGTIYHYFEGKEQLICELYRFNLARVMSIIQLSLDADMSYQEKFLKIWTDLYRFYVKHPNVLIFFEQFVNSPFHVDKSPNQFRGLLYSFFSQGNKLGQIKSIKPEILLVLFTGSIHATAKLHVFGKVTLTRNDLHRIAGILWDGIIQSATDRGPVV